MEEQLYDLLVGSDYINISKWLEIVSKSSLPMTLFLPMEEYNNKTTINDDPFFLLFHVVPMKLTYGLLLNSCQFCYAIVL
jgi:hypothetical protein